MKYNNKHCEKYWSLVGRNYYSVQCLQHYIQSPLILLSLIIGKKKKKQKKETKYTFIIRTNNNSETNCHASSVGGFTDKCKD